MNCRSCGLINRPFEEFCGHCRGELLDPESAVRKRREWDGLSPALRAEQEKHYAALRGRFDEHLRWLRGHRLAHAALGGILVCLGMNAAVFFVSFWPVPIDFALGAAAGALLNRAGGGAYRGLGFFVAAAALSIVLLMPFVNAEAFRGGAWLISSVAVMFVGGGGYYLGLKLDLDHVERQFM
jgi:hypothetical protein